MNIPNLDSIHNDELLYLIEIGEITGQNLIRFCRINHKISEFCYQKQVFQTALMNDYHLKVSDLNGYDSSVDAYARLVKHHDIILYILNRHSNETYIQEINLWLKYQPKIAKLIHRHYPPHEAPTWVNYEDFEAEKMMVLTKDFFSNIKYLKKMFLRWKQKDYGQPFRNFMYLGTNLALSYYSAKNFDSRDRELEKATIKFDVEDIPS